MFKLQKDYEFDLFKSRAVEEESDVVLAIGHECHVHKCTMREWCRQNVNFENRATREKFQLPLVFTHLQHNLRITKANRMWDTYAAECEKHGWKATGELGLHNCWLIGVSVGTLLRFYHKQHRLKHLPEKYHSFIRNATDALNLKHSVGFCKDGQIYPWSNVEEFEEFYGATVYFPRSIRREKCVYKGREGNFIHMGKEWCDQFFSRMTDVTTNNELCEQFFASLADVKMIQRLLELYFGKPEPVAIL